MKKISFMLCAAALMLASTFTSCTNEDNSIYENNVVIRNGYYLNDIIADAIEKSTGNEIVVNLPDTIALRTKADVAIEIPEGKNISIIGKVGAPARVQLQSPFVLGGNFTMKNVEIDASKMYYDFIQSGDKSEIVFDNVKITGYTGRLIGWGVTNSNVSITNSEMEFGVFYTNSTNVVIKDCKIKPYSAFYFGNNDMSIENTEIDATNLWDNLFVMKWPEEAGYTEANEAGCYIVDEINLKNIKVKELKYSFFTSWYSYVFKNFNVENVEAEFNMSWDQTATFLFGNGGALNFNIQNSNFYAKEESYGKFNNFVMYGWGGDYPIPDGAGLGEDTEWSFVYKNNTFDGIVGRYWHEGGNYNKVDLLSIDIENNTWKECQNAVNDIDIIKTLRRWHEADDLKSVVVKNNTITQTTTYDFAAVAEAGENPNNLNGNANNGQEFFVWWNDGAKNRNTNQYKGYSGSSILPEVCHVWRSNDRINGNIVEGGLKCPNDRPMVVDGLDVGSRVQIFYDATEAKEDAKELVWGAAIDDEGKVNGATAKIGGAEAVSMETAIPSGAEIVVTSITPEKTTGKGYIVFWEKKNMIISKVVIVNQRED